MTAHKQQENPSLKQTPQTGSVAERDWHTLTEEELFEELQAYREARRLQEEEEQQRKEAERQRRARWLKAEQDLGPPRFPVPREAVPLAPAYPAPARPAEDAPASSVQPKPELVCRTCGRKTRDWVTHYGIDNTCECRECTYGEP